MNEYIIDMAYTLTVGWNFLKLTIMICWILGLIYVVIDADKTIKKV